MYSDAVTRHALDLTHAGSAGDGAFHGEAGDGGCGDELRIELAVEQGVIARARHRSFACPHATAAAALTCRLVEGRHLLEAACLGAASSRWRPSTSRQVSAAAAVACGQANER